MALVKNYKVKLVNFDEAMLEYVIELLLREDKDIKSFQLGSPVLILLLSW
jgi:hypothetical protein